MSVGRLTTSAPSSGQSAKDHFTVEEIADLTARSPYTVRRWIAEGRIKAIRVQGSGPKGRLLIARDQLEVLLAGGMGSTLPDAVVV